MLKLMSVQYFVTFSYEEKKTKNGRSADVGDPRRNKSTIAKGEKKI